MIIAIVGSRDFAPLGKIEKYIRQLPLDTVIISGGARGVDRLAVSWAKFMGMETLEYLPDWNKYGKSAGMRRNSDIVANCDRLVAFWDGSSKGTKDSIDKAKLAGKEVEIIK